MEKQITFSKISKISRVVILLLCFTLLFVTVAKPITANAVVGESIALGVSGIAGVSVSWPIVVVVLAVIAVSGLVGGSLSRTVDTAKNWYNSSEAVRKWADTAGADVAEGSTTIYIPPDVSRYFNNKNNEDQPLNMTTMYIPASFLMLDSLTRTDLLGVDVGGLLTEGNDLAVETNSILNKIRIFFGSFDLNIKSAISSTTSSIKSSIRVLSNNMMNRLDTVNTTLSTFRTSVINRFENVKTLLSEGFETLRSQVNTINNNMMNRLDGILTKITTLGDSTLWRLNTIEDLILNTRENIDKVTKAVKALPAQIADTLGGELTKVRTSIDVISNKLDELLKAGTDVTTKPQIQVQAGTQTIVVSDYATMGQAFSAKMGWIPQLFDFLKELRSRLYEGTAPKVAIDLSDAEGSYNYGGRVYVLDMSWYARYKPSVDAFLSGVMWICFGWALYKRIPDILSGVGLTVENATETRGHVWSDRAERDASLSYRQQRREEYYQKHPRR